MAEKDLNQQPEDELNEDELLEEQPLNQDEEDEFEVEEDDANANTLSDEEKERIALDAYNKATGKNYKSMADVVKSEKERDKLFAQHPRKVTKDNIPTNTGQPAAESQQLDPEVLESVIITRYPELGAAPETLRELKEAAELKGVSMFAVYKESNYLQNRAKNESSSRVADEENRGRVSSPSGNEPGKPKLKYTVEDKRIADKFFKGDVARYLKHKSGN